MAPGFGAGDDPVGVEGHMASGSLDGSMVDAAGGLALDPNAGAAGSGVRVDWADVTRVVFGPDSPSLTGIGRCVISTTSPVGR